MLIFNYGSKYLLNKVVLTKFINVCRMVWDLIWGVSCLYQSKIEEAKRGGKPAIWPILCCRQSIIVVSTPPSSMSPRRFHVNNNLFLKTKSSFTNCRWTFDSFCSLRGGHFTKWRNTSNKSQVTIDSTWMICSQRCYWNHFQMFLLAWFHIGSKLSLNFKFDKKHIM